MANQNQERARLWHDCHSMSESLSTVSKVAMWALAVVPMDVLPASQSFGSCRVHIQAPLLWLAHQKYFLPSKDFTNALSSLLSLFLGGLFFHAHLSVDFFFVESFIFFWSFIFLAADFCSFVAVLLFLSTVPRHFFFKELISAVMATIISCSSVGFPMCFHCPRVVLRICFRCGP